MFPRAAWTGSPPGYRRQVPGGARLKASLRKTLRGVRAVIRTLLLVSLAAAAVSGAIVVVLGTAVLAYRELFAPVGPIAEGYVSADGVPGRIVGSGRPSGNQKPPVLASFALAAGAKQPHAILLGASPRTASGAGPAAVRRPLRAAGLGSRP